MATHSQIEAADRRLRDRRALTDPQLPSVRELTGIIERGGADFFTPDAHGISFDRRCLLAYDDEATERVGLLQKAGAFSGRSDQEHITFLAAETGRADMVAVFLDAGDVPVDDRERLKLTHALALRSTMLPLMMRMISEFEVPPNGTTRDGDTVMHTMVKTASPEDIATYIPLLVMAGARTDIESWGDGRTPIELFELVHKTTAPDRGPDPWTPERIAWAVDLMTMARPVHEAHMISQAIEAHVGAPGRAPASLKM